MANEYPQSLSIRRSSQITCHNWIHTSVENRLRQILTYLPFQGMSYTPVAIFVGQIDLGQVPRAFAVQLVWLIILAVGSRRLYATATKRLAVQGG